MPRLASALGHWMAAVLATVAMGAPVPTQAGPAGSGATLFEGGQAGAIQSAGKTGLEDFRRAGEGAGCGNVHLDGSGPGPGYPRAVARARTRTDRVAAGMIKSSTAGFFEDALDDRWIAAPVDIFVNGRTYTGTTASTGSLLLDAGEHRLASKAIMADPKAGKPYSLGLDHALLTPGDASGLVAPGPRLKASSKPAAAAAELKIGNAVDVQARTPAEQRAAFTVPDGFEIDLVASEETGLPKPSMVAFDDAGRLWSATATAYPCDNDPDLWTRPGNDRIVIIDDPCSPGPHPVRTFADGMVMPLSVLPSKNGAYVAQGPDIVFLADTDGDGKADSRKVLLHGFGVQDTHTLPHQLFQMPGGRIVYSQGVLNTGKVTDAAGRTIDIDRTVVATFRPDGTGHEIVGVGLNNIWSWALSRQGRVFVHEANDFGYSVVPFEEDSTYPSFIQTKLHPATPMHPPTAQGLDLGGTGFSGLALCDDRSGSYPAPWHGRVYVANPILGKIHAVATSRGPDGVSSFQKTGDLVSCTDPMFRPVAITFGPDGCLYITDWYNRIISHNEVARDHPGRDKTRGRIWRVRHRSQTARAIPDLTRVPEAGLVRHLAADNTWEMRAAWHQIAARAARSTAPALATMVRDAATPTDTRIHALWSLEDIGAFDAGLWKEMLASSDSDLRREAVRALSSLRIGTAIAAPLLRPLAAETDWSARYAVLRYFRRAGAAATDLEPFRPWSAVPADARKVDGWNGPFLALGGAYERAFQDFLALLVTDTHPAAKPTDPRWDQVIATQPVRSPEKAAAMVRRIAAVQTAVAAGTSKPTDPGQSLVRTLCLACHRIGDKGVALAPPLDGAASRDTEALITAILDPDAAIENVFRAYRVELTNGTKAEGFRKGLDESRVTLMSMGGGTRSIPTGEIKAAGYVDGRSVMPPLAVGLQDSQVADIVLYLKTLK